MEIHKSIQLGNNGRKLQTFIINKTDRSKAVGADSKNKRKLNTYRLQNYYVKYKFLNSLKKIPLFIKKHLLFLICCVRISRL